MRAFFHSAKVLLATAALFTALGVTVTAFAQPVSPGADAHPVEVPASGRFQTMCVRSCDGFYFPLRQNAVPQNFARDAEACTAGCGAAGRLFYFPVSGGGPETMVDLAGHKYADDPNAFAFRKAISPQCACKPAPWSAAAAAEHERYASDAAERRLKMRGERTVRAVAKAEKASAEISAAAARDYYDSDPDIRRSPRENGPSMASVIPANQSSEGADLPARRILRVPGFRSDN